jgi:allantoin racemase
VTIRLWHQSFSQLDKLPVYREALQEHLNKVASPGTEVVLHGMAPGTHATAQPGRRDVTYPYFHFMHGLQFLDYVRQAEAEGYDGFLLSTFPDPGLQIAQSLVDIPVVGYGFSSMHTAAYLGRRFGIVSFLEPLLPYYAENVRLYGLERLGGPTELLGLSYDDVHRGYADPKAVIEAFSAAARRLMAQGVDVILAGEAPLGLLLQRAGVHRIDDAVVMDGLGTVLKTAEMLVGLRRSSDMRVTRRGFFHARPSDERIDEVLRFYGRK